MPRYFFHIHDGAAFPDTDGTDLPDLIAARNEAVRLAGNVIAHIGDKFWDEHHAAQWTLEIADEKGTRLVRLNFSGELLN